MVTRKRSMKLRMSEFDEDFSDDFAEGSEVRLRPAINILHMDGHSLKPIVMV